MTRRHSDRRRRRLPTTLYSPPPCVRVLGERVSGSAYESKQVWSTCNAAHRVEIQPNIAPALLCSSSRLLFVHPGPVSRHRVQSAASRGPQNCVPETRKKHRSATGPPYARFERSLRLVAGPCSPSTAIHLLQPPEGPPEPLQPPYLPVPLVVTEAAAVAVWRQFRATRSKDRTRVQVARYRQPLRKPYIVGNCSHCMLGRLLL